MALGDAAALERLVEWCVAGGAGLKHAPCPSTRQVEPAQDMATQQGAGGAPARPNFTGLWESDEGLDEFLAARGVSYLRRCVAVPLQASVTQGLRLEGDALVQHSSSRLSSFTQLQRAGATTQSRDAQGARVTLTARWEGDVWVVVSRAAPADGASASPPPAPLETRRWLEPNRGGTSMRFDVSTLDQYGARVTACRRLRRVSWDPVDVPSVEEAAQGSTVPGTAWSALFGSADDAEPE